MAFLREASIARQRHSAATSKQTGQIDGQSVRALSAPLASPDAARMRGTTRADDAQGTPTQSPTSPPRFPWSGLISVEEAEAILTPTTSPVASLRPFSGAGPSNHLDDTRLSPLAGSPTRSPIGALRSPGVRSPIGGLLAERTQSLDAPSPTPGRALALARERASVGI